MSFTIYQANGLKTTQWFKDIEEVINSMLTHPKDTYHRN
jgi:hypothetical protein